MKFKALSNYKNMKNTLQNFLGIPPKSFILPALVGALLPSCLLIFLILANPNSYALWMFFPLLLIPAGGATAGIFFYLMGFHWFPSGAPKLIAVIFSVLLYFVAIWISAILAFNFTGHWD